MLFNENLVYEHYFQSQKSWDVGCHRARPLFFLLYINDLKAAASCYHLLYADDSVLLVAHKDKTVVEYILGEDLQNVNR